MKFLASSLLVLVFSFSCSHYSHHGKHNCDGKQCDGKQCEYNKDGKKNCQCEMEKKEEAKKK